MSGCSMGAFVPACSLGGVPCLGWVPRMTSVKAALWDGTMLLSPGLPLDVLPQPLLSHCARSSSCVNFAGLLVRVFELPPRDWEITQLQGCCKHERHRLSVNRLYIWLVPKMSVAQESCVGQTPTFQGKQPEETTAFPDPNARCAQRYSFIPPDTGT